ncbi:MAG: M50 family metallopeptidase [Bacillota bacterium]
MLNLTGIAAFLVVFGTIVLIHELGHFMVARWSGVMVREFSIGFGPVVARIRRGLTSYSFRLLPLGGFVRLEGMENLGEGSDPGEDHLPRDDPRRFQNRPLWQRMATIGAGPAMNFLLAGVLFAVLFVPPVVQELDPQGPAAAAGVQPGDRLVRVQDVNTPTATRVLRTVLGTEPGDVVEVWVSRQGQSLRFEIRTDPDRPSGYLGIRMGGPRRPLEALYGGFVEMIDSTGEIIRVVGRMILGREALNVAGPIGIYSMVEEAASRGPFSVIGLAAVLNVNLGLINLLPLPVLDGGWLLFMVLEWVRRRPLEPQFQSLAQVLGFMLLLALMLLATYLDLRRLG